MSFLKCFISTFISYVVFNFIFMILFLATGGIPGANIGEVFSTYAAGDWAGFVTLIFQPGGRQGSFYLSLMDFGAALTGGSPMGPSLSTGAYVMGILWVIMPGLISAAIGGYKYSEGEIKIAYFSTLVAILLANIVPLVIGAAGLLDPNLPDSLATATIGIIPLIYVQNMYIYSIMAGVVNGAVFGGTSAFIAESNY